MAPGGGAICADGKARGDRHAGSGRHVFDRFWRADRARSRASERGGFGLGLAISQWIVQAHGGSLTVQSRLGRGSVFTVVLPVVPDAVPDEATASEPDTATESAESQ